jgi:serine/threonine protein kinase
MKGYELTKIINTGSYSTVYSVIRKKDKQIFALKMFNDNNNTSNKELFIMKKLHIYSKKIKLHKKIGIIMTFYGNQDLYDLHGYTTLRHLSHTRKKEMLYNILTEVENVNLAGIIHADIKLENFVVEYQFPLKLKLVDFGLSEIMIPNKDYVKLSQYKGTKEYLSPEVVYHKVLYRNSDLFAIGVIAIQIWTDHTKYNDEYIYTNYLKCVEHLKYKVPVDVHEFICSTVTSHSKRLSHEDLKKLPLFS